MDAPNNEAVRVLQNLQDVRPLLKRLHRYAGKRYANIEQTTHGKVSAEWLVSEALTQVLEGKRATFTVRSDSPENDLYYYLCWAIRSLANHAINKVENKRTEELNTTSEAHEPPARSHLPLSRQENEQKIRALFPDDHILQGVVLYKAEHMKRDDKEIPASEIAEHLGVSTTEIYDAQRRLSRRIPELLVRLKQGTLFSNHSAQQSSGDNQCEPKMKRSSRN